MLWMILRKKMEIFLLIKNLLTLKREYLWNLGKKNGISKCLKSFNAYFQTYKVKILKNKEVRLGNRLNDSHENYELWKNVKHK